MRPKTFAVISACILATLCCNPLPTILFETGRITAEQSQKISSTAGGFFVFVFLGLLVIWLMLWSKSKQQSSPENTVSVSAPSKSDFGLGTIVLVAAAMVLCALLPIAIGLFVVEPESPGAWETFSSPDGAFRAKFPGTPDESQEDQQYASGITIPRYILSCGTEDQRGNYGIEVQDYPAEVAQVWPAAPDVLRKVQDSIVGSNTLHSEQDLQLGAHPGREFVFEYPEHSKQFFTFYRIYLVGNRAYLLSVTKATSLSDVQTVGLRFANSFELLTD